MTSRELINNSKVQSEIDFAGEAVQLLRDWSAQVRDLPQLLSTDPRKRAAGALVRWYEEASEDEAYSADPPIEGLDALIDELAEAAVPMDTHAELAQARWAVRVAEELVRLRSSLVESGDGARETADATNRLELAIEGARRQMGSSGGLASASGESSS
jgi:hypothetical protein